MSRMDTGPGADAGRFWKDGHLLIKGAFAPEEIDAIRGRAYRACEEDAARGLVVATGRARCPRGDLLSKERLRGVLLDARVVGAAREILGAQPVYFGDSSYQIGAGALGWHKDSREGDRHDPRAPDWQGRYPVIRFGLYLQDHARHGGGLGVRDGSHEVASDRAGRPRLVDHEVGDLVAWNLRTTHSGNSVRLRPLPRLKLDPWLEDRLPRALRVGEQRERVALFFTLGAQGPHLTRYIESFRGRDYGGDYLRASRFGPEVWDLAARAGLAVVRPIPEYGTPPDGP